MDDLDLEEIEIRGGNDDDDDIIWFNRDDLLCTIMETNGYWLIWSPFYDVILLFYWFLQKEYRGRPLIITETNILLTLKRDLFLNSIWVNVNLRLINLWKNKKDWKIYLTTTTSGFYKSFVFPFFHGLSSVNEIIVADKFVNSGINFFR